MKMILKITFGIVLLPVVIMLSVIQWVGIAVISIAGLIFRIIAMLFFITGVGVWAFGLDPASVMIHYLIYGLIFLAVPDLAFQVVKLVALANATIKEAAYGI
jgi:hypothetical protein